MKLFLITCFLIIGYTSVAQRIPQVPDSIRNKIKRERAEKDLWNKSKKVYTPFEEDSLKKEVLVAYAFKNPLLTGSDATINIAAIEKKRAENSWLSSINVGANINEFVVNNSPAANFFPKYNLGINIPLDIISRIKLQKKIADQNSIIGQSQKYTQQLYLKAQVLTYYEDYKQRKELLSLQKTSVEYDLSAYEAAQKSYADGVIKLEEMNKVYQTYLIEKSKLITLERDINVAKIQMEQIIGVSLEEAFIDF
jgi:outer membrane protein TolC